MKLFELVDYLSTRLRYEATYLEMKYYVKRILNNKNNAKPHKKYIDHYSRGIGKSCALARLSIKYNIPILVASRGRVSLYKADIPRRVPKYFKKKVPTVAVLEDGYYNRLGLYDSNKITHNPTSHVRNMPLQFILFDEGFGLEFIENHLESGSLSRKAAGYYSNEFVIRK